MLSIGSIFLNAVIKYLEKARMTPKMTALKIIKKVVLEAVFLIGIIALTLYSIFHEQDRLRYGLALEGQTYVT